MAEYGVQTWDASGKVNNYGIKPVSVCGYLQLAVNQKTGSYSVTLPPGCKLTYFQVMNDDKWGTGRRKITISWRYCNSFLLWGYRLLSRD